MIQLNRKATPKRLVMYGDIVGYFVGSSLYIRNSRGRWRMADGINDFDMGERFV